jgi:hypothetical protein
MEATSSQASQCGMSGANLIRRTRTRKSTVMICLGSPHASSVIRPSLCRVHTDHHRPACIRIRIIPSKARSVHLSHLPFRNELVLAGSHADSAAPLSYELCCPADLFSRHPNIGPSRNQPVPCSHRSHRYSARERNDSQDQKVGCTHF